MLADRVQNDIITQAQAYFTAFRDGVHKDVEFRELTIEVTPDSVDVTHPLMLFVPVHYMAPGSGKWDESQYEPTAICVGMEAQLFYPIEGKDDVLSLQKARTFIEHFILWLRYRTFANAGGVMNVSAKLIPNSAQQSGAYCVWGFEWLIAVVPDITDLPDDIYADQVPFELTGYEVEYTAHIYTPERNVHWQ